MLRTLRERSATLAPVEPRFPPDLAPLLSRVVDAVAVHERQRTIAGLNAWRPPEPEEWLPLDAALPPDVADPERVLEQYSLHAEYLVALYFWRDDFTQGRLREAIDEHLVPAVGAYLGEVLVQHLDGRWIPRKKLMEAQVLAGGRVWLPMKRAWRYLRSRQSLLDSSLTQLYREAERHRS